MAEPRALAMEWIRAYNEHDVDGFRALMAPNYRHERNGVVLEGAENFIEHIKRDWTTWPPCRWTVKDVTVAASRVAIEGTWDAESTVPVTLRDGSVLPPTGKQGTVPVAWFFETRDNKVLSGRGYWDGITLMSQLGHKVTFG